MSKMWVLAAVLASTFAVSGCSTVKKVALRTTVDIFDDASLAVEEETDIELTRPAIFATAKILEGFLKGDPDNVTLNTLVIKTYFTLGFVYYEDEWEEHVYRGRLKKAAYSKKKANEMYKRAASYGFRMLADDCGYEGELAYAPTDKFKECVGDLDDDLTELAFFTGFAWSKFIFLNLDNPKEMGGLPKLLAMMDWVREENETIYFGSLYTFYGSYYGSRSRMLGGNPKESKKYFEKAADFNKNSNLLVHLFKAQFYAKQVMDEKLFEKELKYVINFEGEHHPRLGLLNAVSKRKAKRLLAQKEDLF